MILHEGVRDNLFGVKGVWNERRCTNAACGLVWIDPMPVEEDLHEAYSSYYTHGDVDPDTGKSRFRGPLRRAVRSLEQVWLALLGLRAARKKIDLMFLDDVTPGRVLEVGCGEGALLDDLKKRGWSVEGQEVDENAAKHARQIYGLDVHVGDLVELALEAGRYDAIVMTHVLEHVHDPRALLAECRRLLAPGGRVVIATPNPNSYGHAKFGASWRGLEPPRHLHLFPPAAAARLAELAGFDKAAAWTSVARANGILAASRELQKYGEHEMRGPLSTLLVLSAMWYQLTARLAYLRRKESGEETVLRAS